MTKTPKLIGLLLIGAASLTSCKKEGCTDPTANNYNEEAKKDDGSCLYDPETKSFTVTIENNQTEYAYRSSGIFNTPVGASAPGGAAPGNSYEFTIQAGPGSKLSFATMFVGSNDLFYAPDGNGIELFSGNTPVTGDITSQIILWDAGTEVNEMPGTGANQPMNQTGPNTGITENGTVRDIADVTDGFTYPSTASTIKVSLATGSTENEFVVTIENLAGSTSPLAPGVWVVHSGNDPLFTEGTADFNNGLEALAEDGEPAQLGSFLADNSGLNTPFTPGVWAIHATGMPIFTLTDNASAGLESLAEDGDPSTLNTALSANSIVTMNGVFNTPSGASAPGPLMPGSKYEFTFTAQKGDYLSLATMFVQSNDLFYGFSEKGIALWTGDMPISGDITSALDLWDAGTEANEYPGGGLNQPLRQAAVNTGTDESNAVQIVNDSFNYMPNMDNIKISIQAN